MANIRRLAGKTLQSLSKEGLRKTGEKAKQYLNRRREEQKEGTYLDGCFRDVLFINGCDETLPHPGRYRVSHQREQLESLGVSTGEVYFQNLRTEALRCYRTFVFFRCPCTQTIEEFVETAKKLNKTVLYDVDDLVIDTLYTDQIAYLDSMTEKERCAYDENVRSMGKLLRLCDGAVTTTKTLAEELRNYVPKVFINRNVASEEMVKLSQEALKEQRRTKGAHPAADARKKSAAMSQNGREKTLAGTNKKTPETDGDLKEPIVRLGYFSGSITHNEDLQMILPVLVKLLSEYPSLHLRLAGELSLPDKLLPFRGQIETVPFTDWRELPRMIAGVDINLAPLTDTVFNQAKSENKWLEAALVKVPTVASRLGAFAEMLENGKTGLLCKGLSEWEGALRALIESNKYRAQIGEAAFAFCMRSCVTAYTGQGLWQFLKEQERENIAFFLPGFQVSGGVMVALQHAKILQKAGWDVQLFSIADEGKERWYEFEGSLFPVLNVHDCLVLGRIDQGVATMWSTLDWVEKCRTICRRSYLVQNFEPGFYAPGDPLRLKARSTYAREDSLRYLTVSRWCAGWLYESFGQKAKYAPNGLCAEKFPVRRRDLSGRIRILIEGDCTAPHKNVDESFRIVKRLGRKDFEVWYMAYHGTPKQWYPLDSFFSEVPYGKVQEIYSQCDILIKSSILESFSYPPLEMMATGGYVVAAKNDGSREYLEDGVNCLTYPAGDISAAVQAVRKICRDSTLQDHLFENGLKTARERDWDLLRSRIVALYR